LEPILTYPKKIFVNNNKSIEMEKNNDDLSIDQNDTDIVWKESDYWLGSSPIILNEKETAVRDKIGAV